MAKVFVRTRLIDGTARTELSDVIAKTDGVSTHVSVPPNSIVVVKRPTRTIKGVK